MKTAGSYFANGYSAVNGLNMYYEIYGEGKPMVLIHGGGSTIQTTFGRLIPLLSANRMLICMELQAHGRTADRTTPLSFQQDADDIAALLSNLHLDNVDFLGFSNGGQTLIEIALRHSHIIDKIIIASAFYNRGAIAPAFWNSFEQVQLFHMPMPLQEGFLAVNNNATALQNMFNRDVERMKNFKGWTEEQLQSIQHPTLVMNANQDVAGIEHAVSIHRLIAHSQLIILPGAHGEYLGTIETLNGKPWKYPYTANIIEAFLNEA